MNLSKRHFILFIISGLLLSLGLINYLINHSTIWFIKSTNLNESVARKGAGVFLLGYFSDLMWCVSFYLVLLIFIEREWISVTAFYQLLLLPFCTEFLQFAQLINGTADIFDILLYGIVCILFLTVFSKAFSGLKQMNYKIIKHRLLVANYYLFFLLVAIASTAPIKPISLSQDLASHMRPLQLHLINQSLYRCKLHNERFARSSNFQ